MNTVGTDFYYNLLDEHGPTARGVGWRGIEDQWMRFDRLLLSLTQEDFDRPVRILDVGCGYGELIEWIDTHFPWDIEYTGVDVNYEMIRLAEKRYSELPNVNFIRSDVCELSQAATYDVVVGSGVLAYHPFLEQVKMLKAMWALCGGMMAFNTKCRGTEARADLWRVLELLEVDRRWAITYHDDFREATVKLWR